MNTKTENKWAQPQDVTDTQLVFPAQIAALMPTQQEIPDEFKRGRTVWNKMFQQWFYGGLGEATIKMQAGVDQKKALRHLMTIMGSFEPKHEHKESACGWLYSLWFKSVKSNGKTYK